MRYPFLSLLLLAFVSSAFAQKSSQAELQEKAKVTKQQATAAALAKVPGGIIKESELEREHGKLVWSFDIASPGTKNITEIQVDALTGEVISQQIETPKHESAEKRAEKTKIKKSADPKR